MVPGPHGTHAALTAPVKMAEKAAEKEQPYLPPLVRVPGPVGNIAKGIAGVMAQVGTIRKGGRNEYFGYDYARMEDLLQVVTPLMGKNGLAVIQNELEIKQVENRVAVTYEFSIFHESGEVWPDRPRFTGVALARDRKGNWDDKAITKCHTAARKYFLLSLFQVPAGDFADNDAGSTLEDKQANQRPVPGPARGAISGAGKSAQKEGRVSAPAQETVDDDEIPHKIVLGPGAGADQWAGAYIRHIGKAGSEDTIRAWDKANDPTLQMLSDQFPDIYNQIGAAVDRRLAEVGAPSHAMPDPKKDPNEAMNWIASQLQQTNTLEAATAFWNQMVAPHETSFDQTDWEMLLGEWQRTEARLSPPEDNIPDDARAGT